MESRRAIEVLSPAPEGRSPAATVTLAFEDRHRRRIRMTDDAGAPFLLDLPRAVLLADGDGLLLEDGDVIQVCAAVEKVADIHCADPVMLARIAWHVGNRHVPVQVLDASSLRILDDHVLVAMVEGLGGTVTRRAASFAPEGGAYGDGVRGGHHHGH